MLVDPSYGRLGHRLCLFIEPACPHCDEGRRGGGGPTAGCRRRAARARKSVNRTAGPGAPPNSANFSNTGGTQSSATSAWTWSLASLELAFGTGALPAITTSRRSSWVSSCRSS